MLIANEIFHVIVLLLIYFFAINLGHRKFVTADIRSDITAVFVNNKHGSQRRDQDFD